jgi:excisionase family DNA binding protein
MVRRASDKMAHDSDLTVQEVAIRLGVSDDIVYENIYRGRLKAFNVSPRASRTNRRYWRITEQALDDFRRA